MFGHLDGYTYATEGHNGHLLMTWAYGAALARLSLFSSLPWVLGTRIGDIQYNKNAGAFVQSQAFPLSMNVGNDKYTKAQ